jgi:hypothetical protein
MAVPYFLFSVIGVWNCQRAELCTPASSSGRGRAALQGIAVLPNFLQCALECVNKYNFDFRVLLWSGPEIVGKVKPQ